MSFKLDHQEPLADGFRRVAGEGLEHAIQTIAEARGAGVAAPVVDGAVHEARKVSKNLRALLRLFRPGLGRTYRTEDAALRDAARRLAAHRDRRVLCDTIRSLAGPKPHEIDAVIDRLDDDDWGTPDVGASLGAAEALLREIRDRVEEWVVERPRHSAAEGVRTVYRQGRAALRRCGEKSPDKRWHESRKHVKYHWNHARLLRDRHPVVEDYVRRFGELAQTLGALQDVAVLRTRIDSADDDLSALRPAADARAAELRDSARGEARALYSVRPRAIGALTYALLGTRHDDGR